MKIEDEETQKMDAINPDLGMLHPQSTVDGLLRRAESSENETSTLRATIDDLHDELAAVQESERQARGEIERLEKREEFLKTNPKRLEIKANLLEMSQDELAERFIFLQATNLQNQYDRARAETAEVDVERRRDEYRVAMRQWQDN